MFLSHGFPSTVTSVSSSTTEMEKHGELSMKNAKNMKKNRPSVARSAEYAIANLQSIAYQAAWCRAAHRKIEISKVHANAALFHIVEALDGKVDWGEIPAARIIAEKTLGASQPST